MKNNTNLIIAVVVVLLLLGGGVYFMTMNKGATPGSTMMESSDVPTSPSESMMVEGSTGGTDMIVNPDAKNFTVTGSSFSFDIQEMRVKVGDTVQITFKNSEGFHDWVLDEFNARTSQLQAGGEETITFVADKAGEFEYYCSVGNHRAQGMVGKLIVE